MRCVLWLRVSHRGQKEHLRSQATAIKRALVARGVQWIGGKRVIGPANADSTRREFADLIRMAEQHNAFVVAESTSRFIRSDEFSSQYNRNAWPTPDEFDQLKRLARGVPLVTVHHPDLPPKEKRREQTKRGMLRKEKRGGRPHKPGYKKRQREREQRRSPSRCLRLESVLGRLPDERGGQDQRFNIGGKRGVRKTTPQPQSPKRFRSQEKQRENTRSCPFKSPGKGLIRYPINIS